jgi:hypothetical protein
MNEPSNPKVKTYTNANQRASFAAAASSNRGRASTFVDKGMEKLNQAQDTLDVAKKEAKSTLAPILERMKHSREIKIAEKVLRGMSTLLEYPHQMKKFIEKNEFSDAITIYKRILLIPNNSSLKIIPKIKLAADSVINELRRHCYQITLTPNLNYQMILKHANYIQELDGTQAYLDLLRLSFLRQLFYFCDLLKKLKEKFFTECIESYHKGQEINIISNNTLLAKGESDTVNLTIKKFLADLRNKRRNSSLVINPSVNFPNAVGVHPPGTTMGGSSRKRASFTDNLPTSGGGSGFPSPMRTSSRGSFSSDNGNRFMMNDNYTDNNTENNDFMSEHYRHSDDFMTVIETEDEWLSEKKRNPMSEFEVNFNPNNNATNVFNQFEDDLPTNQDYSELFCNSIRKLFADSLVEMISKWFPCLFRLSFEIVYQQSKFNAANQTVFVPPALNKQATQTFNTGLKAGGNKAAMLQQSMTSANRLLATVLDLSSFYLQQSVNGFKEDFVNASVFPTELLHAFQELEASWMTVESNYGLRLPSNTTMIHNDDSINSSRFNDIIVTQVFQASINTQQLREIFDECFVMYQAIETIMKTALTSLNNSLAMGNQLHHPHAGENLALAKFLTSGTNADPMKAGKQPLLSTKLTRDITEVSVLFVLFAFSFSFYLYFYSIFYFLSFLLVYF